MNRRALGITLLMAVAATGLLLWGTMIPLGVPGEWEWPRISGRLDLLIGLGVALTIGTVYVTLIVWGSRRIQAAGRSETLGWLFLLSAGGFAWLWSLQECVPAPASLAKVPYVLFYPRSSGYYWQARHDVSIPAEFLASYEDLLAQQDYLHIGTHPPGLTLGYHGLLKLCDASPGLCEVVLATCPASVSDSLETIRTLSADSGLTVSRADEAALWFASLLTMLATAATMLGMYALVRRHHSLRAAWLIAGLWPLVPATAVFHPKSDTLYPVVAVTVAACWMTACDRRSLFWAIAAGLALWVGMLLSLAFVTVAALMVAMTLWEWFVPQPRVTLSTVSDEILSLTTRQRLLLLTAGAVGVIVPTLLLGWQYDINLINVWRWNLSNHALFYEHNVRTWWKWLLINPWELAVSVGLPVVVMAIVSLWQLRLDGSWATRRASLPFAFLAVWGLLWVSGKNMGEAARLWILLMPWVVMSMAPALDGLLESESERDASSWRLSPLTWLLSAQMVVCVMTVLRIDGFHFSEIWAPPDTP